MDHAPTRYEAACASLGELLRFPPRSGIAKAVWIAVVAVMVVSVGILSPLSQPENPGRAATVAACDQFYTAVADATIKTRAELRSDLRAVYEVGQASSDNEIRSYSRMLLEGVTEGRDIFKTGEAQLFFDACERYR